MDKSVKDLLSAWRGIPLTKPPYILEGDRIEGFCHPYRCFTDYIRDPNFGDVSVSSNKFHSGLIPIPYSGNIQRAKIYILTLNPGFGPHDYYAESYDKSFRDARIQQLRQQKLDKDFPFMGLNPSFLWHSKYWIKRFGDIIHIIKKQKKNVSYTSALSLLSQSIACLEYIPYHSISFGLKKAVINGMRSPKIVKAFVDDYVIPRVIKGDAFIIVTRNVDLWLSKEQQKLKNVVTYNATESRAAYLNSKSRGGKIIAEAMEIKIDS